MRHIGLALSAGLLIMATGVSGARDEATAVRAERVRDVQRVPGLAAFWDFVAREPGSGRFVAHTAQGTATAYPLDAVNYVREYWQQGRAATYDDFPRVGRGPFGNALRIRSEQDATFRPTLLLPRERFHGGPLDVGGPGRSVSMVVWIAHEAGTHAVAGIWHEGTDLLHQGRVAARVEAGRRQYALFAGLAANAGAAAVHVSENGRASFGDRYARHLAVTRRLIPSAGASASDEALHAVWSVMGFVFDNERNRVTAYLDGRADDYWIEQELFAHPFFKWPAEAWRQTQLHGQPGLQEGEDPAYPPDQFFAPPEARPVRAQRVSETDGERITELTYEFTRVRQTETRDARGRWQISRRELVALRANPFWFPHDLFRPASSVEGGPFTIGRVIHSGRNVGTTGLLGGVAVYDRALSEAEMRRLAAIGFQQRSEGRRPALIALPD